jgi:hypothetical protein
MNLSDSLFKGSRRLPLVFVEKIILLPPDIPAQKQKVEITLSVQKLMKGRMLPYRLFVAFATKKELFLKMIKSESTAKSIIRTANRGVGIKKRYLELNVKDADFNERGRDSAGASIIKKSLTITEEFDLDNVENLYMYATAYAIDPQSKTKSGVERKIVAMSISQPIIESIIVNKQTSNTGVIYVLTESVAGYGKRGSVWSGPVHKVTFPGSRKTVVMAGPAHTNHPHPILSVTRVSNQKVQDKRFLGVATTLPFNNTDPTSPSPRVRKEALTMRKIMSPPIAISDAHYSRTSNDILKILFSIDRARLVKQNVKLGNFILNKEALNSCLQIEDIRVFRSRIAPSTAPNKLTPGKINICGSNASEVADKFIGSLKNGSIRSVDLGANEPRVLDFVITDSSSADADVGTYQYEIFIDVVDLSVDAVGSLSNKLEIGLVNYNKFISNIEIRARKSKKGKKFDFKAYMQANRVQLKRLNKSWQQLIDDYLTAVRFIFGGEVFLQYSSLMWKKNLLAMINPDNGDLKSIREVAELVSDFTMNLQRMYKGATTSGSESAFKVTSRVRAQNDAKRKIRLEHVFAKKYRKTVTISEGTDYLDNSIATNNINNFTNMPFAGFKKRINVELAKYDAPDSNSPAINKYGYLSPRRLYAKGTVIETNSGVLPQSAGNGLLVSATTPAGPVSLPTAPNRSSKIFEAEIDSLLNLSDVNTIPLRQPLINILKRSTEPATDTNAARAYLSIDSRFNKDIEDASTAISGSLQSNINISSTTSHRSLIRRSGLVAAIVNSSAINFRRRTQLTNPDVLGPSLAAHSLTAAPTSQNSFEVAINYNSAAEIQYFDGHTTTNDMVNIDAKNWKTLTKQQFEKLKNSGAQVLCRTVLVNNAVNVPNKYTLPEYDGLFMLGNKPAASINVNPRPPHDLIEKMGVNSSSENKSVSLNIESGPANVDTTHVCSSFMLQNAPAMIGTTQHRPGATSAAPTTAPRGMSSGGGQSGEGGSY